MSPVLIVGANAAAALSAIVVVLVMLVAVGGVSVAGRTRVRPERVRADDYGARTLGQRRARDELSEVDYRQLRAMADRAEVREGGAR